MKSRLFLAELRRSAGFAAAATAALVAVLTVAELVARSRLGNSTEDLRRAMDAFVWIGLILSGVLFGERAFTPGFKSKHSFFLFSLPLSRSWTWAILASSRYLAGLASIGVSLLIRPSMLKFFLDPAVQGATETGRADLAVSSTTETFVIAGFLAVFLGFSSFFAISAVTTLILRQALASTITAVVLWSLLHFAIVPATIYPYTASANAFLSSPEPDDPFVGQDALSAATSGITWILLPWVGLFIVSSTLTMLAASHYLFVRGEYLLIRNRLRNASYLGAALLGLVLLSWIVGSPMAVRAGSTIAQPTWQLLQAVCSTDGTLIGLVERSQRTPQLSRVLLVDRESRTVVAESLETGIVSWRHGTLQFDDHELVYLTRDDSAIGRLGFLRGASYSWVRFSVGGRRRWDFQDQPRGPAGRFVVFGKERELKVEGLESDGPKVVLNLPREPGQVTTQTLSPRPGGEEGLVIFLSDIAPPRAWHLSGTSIEELAVQEGLETSQPIRIVGSKLWQAPFLGAPPFLEGLGTPSAFDPESDKGVFVGLGPRGIAYFASLSCNEQAADLYARDEAGEWRFIAPLPFDRRLPCESPASVTFDSFFGVAVDSASGVALFTSGIAPSSQIELFDPATAESVRVPEASWRGQAALQGAGELESVHVWEPVWHLSEDPVFDVRIKSSHGCTARLLSYSSAERSLTAIGENDCETSWSPLLHLDGQGHQLRQKYGMVVEINRQGQERIIWRSQQREIN